MPADHHEHLDDARLAALAHGGDFAAWETFVRRHGARLLAFCGRLCGDDATARRVWIGALEAAWSQTMDGLQGVRPSTAAFAAATRLCAEKAGGSPAAAPPRRALDAAGLEARSQRLRQCLLTLPFHERAALALCYFDNLPYAEAQRCLGDVRQDVRLLCAKAYASLSAALGPGFLSDGLE